MKTFNQYLAFKGVKATTRMTIITQVVPLSTRIVIAMFLSLILLSSCGGGGDSDAAPSILPTNHAPTISGTPDKVVVAGNEYDFTPVASDPDGDNLRFTVDNLPDWMSFDSTTGRLNGIPVNTNLGSFEQIQIAVSDGKLSQQLPAFNLSVSPAEISKNDVLPKGSMAQISPSDLSEDAASGFSAEGMVELNIGGKVTLLEEADLTFEFDEQDNLLSMYGDVLLPPVIGDYFAIPVTTSSKVGLYKGSNINADPLFGIQLQDDFYYLVYYLGINTDVVLGDRKGGEDKTITLSTPLGGEILLISDPTDAFFYYYSNTFLGLEGKGESDQGFIPFIPNQGLEALKSFDGHKLEKKGMSIGLKALDVFNFVGTRVVKEPQFEDIDWLDPLNSAIEFKAGLNGTAEFALSVFGVGFFEFPVGAASAFFDVGFDRQQMAMQVVLAPDVSWQPDWFPIFPTTEIISSWMFNGDGSFEATLSGDYFSTLPEANMSGVVTINNDGTSLQALIPDAKVPLDVSAQFLNSATIYTVNTQVDMTASIKQDVNVSFDRHLAQTRQAYDELVKATNDYDLEVSLNGLRVLLPAIADEATNTLKALPQKVKSAVYEQVIDQINAKREYGIPTDHQRNVQATNASNSAYNYTEKKTAAHLAAMAALKVQAQLADDETLRATLKAALRNAYANRKVDAEFEVTINLPYPIKDYTYTYRIDKTVLSNSDAQRILQAANNVYRIGQSRDLKIRAGEIYDKLPVEDVIEKARADVAEGLTQLPTFDGAGMTVSKGEMDAYIILSGQQYAVLFNLFDAVNFAKRVQDLATGSVIPVSSPGIN